MDNSGIAFMENMKRLICDDRIVGYEYHCPINDIPGAPIGIYQSDSMEELLHPTNPSHIQAVTDGDQTMDYTSFNPGIEVGDDEWIFSGDIFLMNIGSFGEKMILVFENGRFGFVYENDTKIYDYRDWKCLIKEKIGNIYNGGNRG